METPDKEYLELLQHFAHFRQDIRTILWQHGRIASNPGWTDDDVLDGIRKLAEKGKVPKKQEISGKEMLRVVVGFIPVMILGFFGMWSETCEKLGTRLCRWVVKDDDGNESVAEEG